MHAQLARLVAADADVCTLQVEYVCELDAAAHAVRYFHLPGGGGLFSARLGNPGTMLLRRQAWTRSSSLKAPRRFGGATAHCPGLPGAGSPDSWLGYTIGTRSGAA